jgi:catechol-2,3-dioxygenase
VPAIARLRTIALDTPDPEGLSRFYQGLLGGEVVSTDDDWVDLRVDGARLSFQLAADHQPPDWGDPGRPQQFHIDLTVDDIEAAEPHVLALGATKHDRQPGADSNWRVYVDPSGHPFCLVWDVSDAPDPEG